jgi:hypothetical protein
MKTTRATRYKAVVESGSWNPGTKRYEEARSCGHLHKSYVLAARCGAKLYNAWTVRGSWQANAAWHNYRVHNQDGERVSE